MLFEFCSFPGGRPTQSADIRTRVTMFECIRFLRIIISLCLCVIIPAGTTFANGGLEAPFYREVAETLGYGILGYIMLLSFAITVVTEYVVIYILLGRPRRIKGQLFFWVLFVNIITNPATQIVMLFVADSILLGSDKLVGLIHYTVESVVFVIEFVLFRRIFDLVYRRGLLNKPVSWTYAAIAVLTANVVSYLAVPVTFGGLLFLLNRGI
jgi:hypothetical protein